MVKFGAYTLPAVLRVDREHTRYVVEKPIPSRSIGYRKDIGGAGAVIRISGEIRPRSSTVEDQLVALADGGARTLDFEYSELIALEKVFRQSGTWIDNTEEAASPGGTPFILLGAASDGAYFGHRERYNKLTFDLETLGSYGARTWWYSKGGLTWGDLAVSDGTSGFSQDGTVAFTPPSDWKRDIVNSVADKFWVCVSVASVTTAATVNQILENLVFNCIMLNPRFERPVERPYMAAYECRFMQVENP